MKGNIFKITSGLIEEVLPGLDVYLRITLAKEKLSHEAQTTRGWLVDRLDFLAIEPYVVRHKEESKIPPKVPPRPPRKSKPVACDTEEVEETDFVNVVEPGELEASDDVETNLHDVSQDSCVSDVSKSKPPVPPKPLHLVSLVQSKKKQKPGYYNQSQVSLLQEEGAKNLEEEEEEVEVEVEGDIEVQHPEEEEEEEEEVQDELKPTLDDGEYEPVGQNSDLPVESGEILDSNANIDKTSSQSADNSTGTTNEDSEAPPNRKMSSTSVLSADSALGLNLDIPKIDCRSSCEDVASASISFSSSSKETSETNEVPPVLPKRPQFLTVGNHRPRKVSPPSPLPSPGRSDDSLDLPPPLPPRKRMGPATEETRPREESVSAAGPPADAPPLPPRPPILGVHAQKDAGSEEEFAARQRMISRFQVAEDADEEGDYDSIDKSDNEESKKRPLKKDEPIKEESDGDGTSYESYDDQEIDERGSSSQENIIEPTFNNSKENITSSPYSLTFPRSMKADQISLNFTRYTKDELSDQAMTLPRFKSFRKSKRKANKSLDNVAICQQNAAVFSGEMLHKGKFQWARRFCIVTPGEFLCYKSERDSRPVLQFTLKNFDVAYIEKEGKKHHVIRLSHPGFDTHLFCVDTKERAEMWIEQLNSAVKMNAIKDKRMSGCSLDGVKPEDEEVIGTPKFPSRNSLSNISQASSTSESDVHSYSVAPSISGSQYSVTSVTPKVSEPVSPSRRSKQQVKRPLSTPSSQDIINRAIVLASPTSPYDGSPSPSTRRSVSSLPKSRRTSQIFGSWGKKKPKKSTPTAEPSAPMNFEVYEGTAYDVTVSGYVNIKSQFSSTPEWTKRYCRIKNGFFECYKEITDYRHEFNFPLVGCEIVTAREPHHDLAFKIVQGDIEKIFIEPCNTLDQGRWLAVLIKETCCSQPPPSDDEEDEAAGSIPVMSLSGCAENPEDRVFVEKDVSQSDPGNMSDTSDGYERQAVRNSAERDDMYDELHSTGSEEDGYIESYGPEVVAVGGAAAPGGAAPLISAKSEETAPPIPLTDIKSLDDGYTKIKDNRHRSDSEIVVVRPKTNILDTYAKVDKRSSRLAKALEETFSSKRSSVASEYSDILSAVMNVSKQFTQTFGRSMSFDTGASLKAAVESERELEARIAKEYESFEKLHHSRAGSEERDTEKIANDTLDVKVPDNLCNSHDNSLTVIAPAENVSNKNGAESDLTVLGIKSKFIKTSTKRCSELLYRELADSFGSLDEIDTTDSSSDEESGVPKTLPNLDADLDSGANTKGAFNDMADRKKDSGICGDSSESLSTLIKDEGERMNSTSNRDSGAASLVDNSNDMPDSVDQTVGITAGNTFVDTPISVYEKEMLANSGEQESSADGACGGFVDHQSDNCAPKIPESSENSNVDERTKSAAKGVENIYDEIEKEKGEKTAEDAESHHYSDIGDKDKGDSSDDDSEHDYDPIEFTGSKDPDAESESTMESEYEEYEDEIECIETKQKRANELKEEIRMKKKEWAHQKKFRLALENQRIQSRDPVEKRKLAKDFEELEEKVKTLELELSVMLEEHRVLAMAVTNYFQSRGIIGRKMSMISVESLMVKS